VALQPQARDTQSIIRKHPVHPKTRKKPMSQKPTKTSEVIEEIIARYKAGYPIIWVKTEEYARAIELLRARFLEENKACAKLAAQHKGPLPTRLAPKRIFHWDAINGLVDQTNLNEECPRIYPPNDKKGGPVPEAPGFAHILAWGNQTKIQVVPPGTIILVNGFHNLLAGTSPMEVGKVRAALTQIIQPSLRRIDGTNRCGLREGESFRTVLLIGPQPEHPALTPDILGYIETVALPRPEEDEIQEMIQTQLEGKTSREGKKITGDPVQVANCARELRGTTVFQSENAIALTYIKKRSLDRETLRRQYKSIMESHPALRLAEYQETWEELVGFELYKEFVEALFTNGEAKNRRGILFVGPPGTGKSHAAKATGSHLNVKTLFCNFGRVFNKFLGSSEENTESLFRTIDSCGEVIVFIDEIDKAFGGMGKGHGGDGGVGDRTMNQALTWLNDHDSGAFLIATANDADMLSPEMRREGRWDCIFNVPPPNLQQRTELARLYSGKSGIETDPAWIASITEDWVGAEIRGLMQKAGVFRHRCASDQEAIEQAFLYVKPMHIADGIRFQERKNQCATIGVCVNRESPKHEEQTLSKRTRCLSD
jgi:hypothetical protein